MLKLPEFGIYPVDTHYTGTDIAALYILVQNDEIAIIETGTSYSLPYVLDQLSELECTRDQVRYIIPTHIHLDHAGGAGRMMQEFDQAQLVIHPKGARHMVDPTKLIAGTKAVYGEETFNRLYGDIPAIPEQRIIIADDLHQIDIGKNRPLLFLDTPGHAYHHFCIVDEYSEGIFSGDTFGLSYPDLLSGGKRFVLPTTTPVHFNPSALKQSTDRLMSYSPQRMYLTHFDVLSNPKDHVNEYKEWIDRFVELAEKYQPKSENDIEPMQRQMLQDISIQYNLDTDITAKKLANDIKLNCQGLIHWYLHHRE